jgi:alkylglycerol monooxygenase
VAYFLWHADQAPVSQSVGVAGRLTAGLWAVGAVMQGRTGREVLLIEAAALAAATSAHGPHGLHQVFKPLAMVLAIAVRAAATGWAAAASSLLLAALALCLAATSS